MKPLPIRTILVEDNREALASLKDVLKNSFDFIEIAGTAETVKEALALISQSSPDLVFLDIELPDGTAFDLLSKSKSRNFEVIFCTAFTHYAIRAIKSAAFDYLVKPIDPEELRISLTNLSAKLEGRKREERIQHLLHHFEKAEQFEKIILSTSKGYEVVRVSDIIYCQADGNYTKFFISGKRCIMVSKNLKEYEDILTPINFFRSHHSCLVNLSMIVSIAHEDGGYIITKENYQVPLSRRKRPELIKSLNAVSSSVG